MVRLTPKLTTLYTLFVCICIFASHAAAGITGKISGIVLDAEFGEPVVGATIRVIGTNLVTQTDIDGEYFIINVTSGKYDVSVTTVGFEQTIKKDVRVLVDLTTPVDFELIEETIELDRDVVVYAENPIIQKDLTASKVIFTSDRLRQLPNIITVQSVLTNYPGVVIGRDEDMHIRGGRSGQVAYYFDGFSVQDPFVSNSGIKIMPNALEELTLTSGGYTAEYGEALSGVVSAVSKEGSSVYSGSIKMYEGMTHPYSVYTNEWGGLQKVGNKSASFQLSGPMPFLRKSVDHFSVAGEYLHDPSSLPHNGIVSYTGTAKLSTQPAPQLRLVSNITYNESQGEIYEHRDVNNRSYDFNLDGLPSFKKEAYLFGLSGNYHVNEKMIVQTRFNHFYTMTKTAPSHVFDKYWSEWDGYSEDSNGVYNGTIDDDNYGNDYDPLVASELVGFTAGNDYNPTFRYRESKYNSIQLSIVNQVDKHNQFKTGIEYRKYDIKWDFKQFYNSQPYGEKYSSKPTYFSFFFQDKMEYEFYIINLGLRYDYRNNNIQYNATPGRGLEATYVDAEGTSNISPRIGISFPVSERSVAHFNYGLYYQVPRFDYLYTNLQGEVESGYPILGNPNLKPEKTTSYEIGLDHMLSDNLRLDVTAYYKDIEDLVSTRIYGMVDSKDEASNPITAFVNEDYGSAKGLDLHLEMLPGSRLISGSVSYGYMLANGIGSDAYEPYYSYITSQIDTIAPVTEFPLDFDQRHTVTAVLDLRVPSNYNWKLFGMSMPTNWGVGLVGSYGSGLPYTITDDFGNRIGKRNEGRLPANYTVDMKFNKDFNMQHGDYKLGFFVEIDNLFDKRNVIDVYTNTGRPDDDGAPTTAINASQDQAVVNQYDRLYDHDPLHYSRPRTIRTGLELNF